MERRCKLELRNLVYYYGADTLLQDSEFLSISILLYDIFAIFSIYKILKSSRCSAVHFFFGLPVLCRSHYEIPRKTDPKFGTLVPLAILKK